MFSDSVPNGWNQDDDGPYHLLLPTTDEGLLICPRIEADLDSLRPLSERFSFWLGRPKANRELLLPKDGHSSKLRIRNGLLLHAKNGHQICPLNEMFC